MTHYPIDQQLVRIITRRYERTISRKIKELILAYTINAHIPKRKLLYCYIHDAYFGYRLIGCEISAQFIFRKTARTLTVEQSAFLACLLPLPLPRLVYELIKAGNFGANFDPVDLLNHPQVSSTRWGKRIKYRFDLAASNYDFVPKSLETK